MKWKNKTLVGIAFHIYRGEPNVWVQIRKFCTRYVPAYWTRCQSRATTTFRPYFCIEYVPVHTPWRLAQRLLQLSGLNDAYSALAKDGVAFQQIQQVNNTGYTPQKKAHYYPIAASGFSSHLATNKSAGVPGSPAPGQRHYSWSPSAQGASAGHAPGMGEEQNFSNIRVSQTRRSPSFPQV